MAVISIAKRKAFSGGSWPTAQQELLLRAALQQGTEAVNAWEMWKTAVPFDQIDPASVRLLPLVYRNMQTQCDLEDPLLQKLKGVYRHAWAMNQLLLQNMAGVIRSFGESEIKTILLKGAALITCYYKDYGLRPMNDFDLLVDPQQAIEAIELLQESGYKLREPMHCESPEVYISFFHGLHFRNDSGNELDLHWHVLSECLRKDSDRDFWSASEPVEFFGIATRVLNSADQLLHVCVHGLIWDPVPAIRWIADALFILNSSKSRVDWDRVIFQARSRRLILFLRNALRYLSELRPDLVPIQTLEELDRSSTSSMEGLEYKYKTQNRRNHPFGHLPQIWFNYARRSEETRIHRKLFGFIDSLAQFFGIHRRWQLPFFLGYMVLRRMILICLLYQKRLVSVFQRQ